MTIRVGINGFGRIGRSVLRAAYSATHQQAIEIVHINDLSNPAVTAHLLQYDSVHGRFGGTVAVHEQGLQVNGRTITVSAQRDPTTIDWRSSKVDIVFECSGVFRQRAQAEKHLGQGASKVLISAPASGDDITVVYGVNSKQLNPQHHNIVSNGSCTTNCLAPLAKVLHEQLGIKRGMMTTVHSYTNDQSILDLPHKDLRRARAAAANMIPTSTGAAQAIGLVIPALRGKIDGMAVRVPTPNVSLVDVVFEVERATDTEAVNTMLVNAADGELNGVLAVATAPLVSSDFNGHPASAIVDLPATRVLDKHMVKVLAWYDNETGFSYRMLDVARLLMR